MQIILDCSELKELIAVMWSEQEPDNPFDYNDLFDDSLNDIDWKDMTESERVQHEGLWILRERIGMAIMCYLFSVTDTGNGFAFAKYAQHRDVKEALEAVELNDAWCVFRENDSMIDFTFVPSDESLIITLPLGSLKPCQI